jgi:hypothetical protein
MKVLSIASAYLMLFRRNGMVCVRMHLSVIHVSRNDLCIFLLLQTLAQTSPPSLSPVSTMPQSSPSTSPSTLPSLQPSSNPSESPSSQPSSNPSNSPSESPSSQVRVTHKHLRQYAKQENYCSILSRISFVYLALTQSEQDPIIKSQQLVKPLVSPVA